MFREQIALDCVKKIHVIESLGICECSISLVGSVFFVVLHQISPKLLLKSRMLDKHSKQTVALLMGQTVLRQRVVEVRYHIHLARLLS